MMMTNDRSASQTPTSLSLGTDLTGLGLNLNAQGTLYSTFSSPFVEVRTCLYRIYACMC